MADIWSRLADYQKFAVHFILNHPYAGLFLDCGLGKTLITLAAIQYMDYTDIPAPMHTLVIAPKNIARSTWLDEIHKWNLPIRTKSFVINEETGRDLTRKKRLERYAAIQSDPPTMYFINRDLLTDLIKNLPEKTVRRNNRNEKQTDWPFPIVIIDESQSFKSGTAVRTKALMAIRRQDPPVIHRLIELTGTPAPNGLEDLWSQIALLDCGERLGAYISHYRMQYFTPTMYVNNNPVNWVPKNGAEDIIYDRISDLVISMKNTLLVLPPVTYHDILVYMSEEESALYKEMLKEQILTLDDTEVTAANAAVLQARLSQIASGALYVDTDTVDPDTGTHTTVRNTVRIHEQKLEMCRYIIDNTSGPVLIAYHFKSDQEMLRDYFPESVTFDGSPDMLHAWNRQEYPIMLIQPASAGFGLNLQEGGHTLIWYTLTWNLEEYIQCNARIYRQGQKCPVIIHHLMTKDTVDEKVLKAIQKKDMTQTALLEAVRATVTMN